jgi:hypothetical protein
LLDLYLVHRRLQFGYGIAPIRRDRRAVCLYRQTP